MQKKIEEHNQELNSEISKVDELKLKDKKN
jgi:hypothetical protein